MIHEAVRDSNSKEEVLLGRLATLAVRHRLEAIVPLQHWFISAVKSFLAMIVEFKVEHTLQTVV
jgi:hypothetical protein